MAFCARFKPHRRRQDNVLTHADGEREPLRTRHWIEREGWPRAELVRGVDRSAVDAARSALAADRRAKKKGGRPGVEMVDVLVAGPPSFTSDDAWELGRCREWAAAVYRRLAELAAPKPPGRLRKLVGAAPPAGGLAVLAAHLHGWEGAPHLHVAFVPLVDGGGARRRSWNLVQARMAERAAGRPVKSRREQMRVIQTALHEAGGAPFGLERGVASDKTHEAPDHALHLADRVRAAERRAKAAERERDAAVAAKQQAEGARDAARRAADAVEERQRNAAADRRREEATPDDLLPPPDLQAPGAFPPPKLPVPPPKPEPKPEPKPDVVVRGQGLPAGGIPRGRRRKR